MKSVLSSVDRTRLWTLRAEGLGNSKIGVALGKSRSSVERAIRARGGIAPRLRQRSARALSLAEREEISRGTSCGDSYRQIARKLCRAPSTISREIARHGGAVRYRATQADVHAYRNARRPKVCHLARNAKLCRLVIAKLECQWSPEQISKWLALRFPSDDTLRVSHETIYRTLFIQARGALKLALTRHLRTGRKARCAKHSAQRPGHQGQILDAVSIRERPAEAEDRAVPGHWEGDLLCGSPGSQIVTLVERHSRFVMLIKTERRETQKVVRVLSRQIKLLPKILRRSLTWDRGPELADHKRFTIATKLKVYFCDPRSPWQRGSNENTNGLLRQYFPKGTDLSHYSQRDLNKVALRLNQRPRKTLGFQTPADILHKVLR